MFKNIAASKGFDIDVDASAIGGYSMQRHCENEQTLRKIRSRQWDYVVLQELSLNPCYPPEVVDTLTYPYAKILSNMVHDNCQCTQLMFYMTWGRQNGYTCDTTYLPLCTFDGMQERLCESYCEMAEDNNGWVAPVGMAFKYMKENYPKIQLYVEDKSHPSPEGTYLAACVFYASIFRDSPVGAEYIYGLDPVEATILQYAASEVVFGDIEKWRLNVSNGCITLGDLKRSVLSFKNIVDDGSIHFKYGLKANYKIYSSTGYLCQQGKVAADNIDVSLLKRGLYLLVVDEEYVFKFVVE